MPRKTKEELRLIRQEKSIASLIENNKYLKEEKYWKNNYWSWAAWDSWAATGKAGGCGCCSNNYYNGTLCNTRTTTKKGGREDICKQVSVHLCYDCITLVQKKINHEFKRH